MKYLSVDVVKSVINLANKYYITDKKSEIVTSSDLTEVVRDCLLDENRVALKNKIDSLSKEEIAELEALMVLGRGFSGETTNDWHNLYEAALRNSESVDYIIKKKKLASFLESGLEKVAVEKEINSK